MKHGSLFSGIGGFDLAAEWMGWENVFHCEWMEFPRKVLDYYWPNADSHIDICKTDFKKYANKIDILTGGWPCQPFSHAGKRKGTKDERFLWHEMLRAIQEIKPKFVIGENVLGITNIDGGLVFEKVCVDLETEGYEVQPFIIPACAKNAPHRRDRCWFIGVRNATNTNGNGFHQCNGNDEINASERGINAFGNISESHGNGDVANPNFGEPKQPTFNCRMGRFGKQHEKDSWKFFPTQSPICGGDDGIPTELDGITFSKWRAESIKGYGNAIVPQVALELFKVIEKINCNLSK
jgi:DNA (cytosine-5)-methyltransferase 1